MNKLENVDRTIRILALVRLDAQRLYERIKYRAPEYLTIYSTKRTRDHFSAVFKNRYDDIKIDELQFCEENVISALDVFYSAVDNLRWYLYTTDDMPNKVDTKVHRVLSELKASYNLLVDAIDEQRGIPLSSKKSIDEKDEVNQVVFEKDLESKFSEIPKTPDFLESAINENEQTSNEKLADFNIEFNMPSEKVESEEIPPEEGNKFDNETTLLFDLDFKDSNS